MGQVRSGHQRGATPVRASLNFTTTSLATIEVSFQSPSPILKSRRLIVKLPVAVVVGPACATCTGTTTSFVAPLIASLPVTSNLPPPRAFTALDWKVACGKAFVLNQSGLTTSASVSAAPSETLARSIVKPIFAVSVFFGSNATWASNFLNLPSTGTPICLLVKAISLWAGTSFCWAATGSTAATRAAAAMSFWKVMVSSVRKDRRKFGGRSAAGRRQHPRKQAVAVDELVFQGAGHVHHHQHGHRVGQVAVPRLDGLGQRLVGRHEVGQRQ